MVFIGTWVLVDVTSQKRDRIKLAFWKVSSLKVKSPLHCFPWLSSPWASTWGTGSSLPSWPLDFHLVGLALLLGSHIPHVCSCTLGTVTHRILFNQVTIFWLAEEPWFPPPACCPSQLLLGVRPHIPLTCTILLPSWQGHFYRHISKLAHPTPISRQSLQL